MPECGRLPGRALLVNEWSMSGTRWAKPLHDSSEWVSRPASLIPACSETQLPGRIGRMWATGPERPSGGA